MISLTFHGAAGTVTGSKYLLEVNERRLLVDCGMFQGAKELRQRNWAPLPFDPRSITAIVLTHGHIDHIGFVPKLVKEGFVGPIYATPPTVDIAALSLLDTAELQMEDAEFRTKKKLTSHEVALPLFTTEDAKAAIKLLTKVDFDHWVSLGPEFRFRYHVVGHLLGAAGVEIELYDGVKTRRVFFSGDVGRFGNPLTVDPIEPPECDYLVCESTYGGRIHEPEDAQAIIAEIIKQTVDSRGILLVPAFAVGRTQQLIYIINDIIRRRFAPAIDIHVDSPMAISATDIYQRFMRFHGLSADDLANHRNVLGGKNVTLHRTRKSSQSLNELEGPAVIISASGMLTGGRILHHLMLRLPQDSTTLALVGFMAEGTLGRQLVDGAKLIYIHKQPVEVKARVLQVTALSGHADYFELLYWLRGLRQAPRTVFVTHGEKTQSEAMAQHLRDSFKWETLIPTLDQRVEL